MVDESLNLNTVLDDSWQALSTAAGSPFHPFRFAWLATVDEGSAAQVRTVVLRAASAEHRELVCFSDARAPKIGQIRANPQVSWCFFDPTAGVQIRALGRAEVLVGGDRVESLFAAVDEASLVNYAAPLPPGTELDGATGGGSSSATSTESISFRALARTSFAVIVTRVDRLDWLQLSPTGNRRARFEWAADGSLTSNWVQA